MKKYHRQTEPSCLTKNSKKWNERWSKKVKINNNSTWNWNEYKKQPVNKLLESALLAGSGNKCAFCGVKLTKENSQLLEIEHFRPKKDFPNFAFTWTNLYPSCHCCNFHKNAQFSEDLIPPDYQEFEENWLEISETSLIVSSHCPEKYRIGLNKTINYYRLEMKDWYREKIIPNFYNYAK